MKDEPDGSQSPQLPAEISDPGAGDVANRPEKKLKTRVKVANVLKKN